MQTSDVYFEELSGIMGNIGLITLNRQQALNALNHAMFKALDYHLTKWEANSRIKAVIIRAAEGRAFCAGGDVRQAYERKLANDVKLELFFRDEYTLNRRIFHYSKPYIALLDGITMGGGAGVSIHGSHRIATERMVFAMPETSIGFFPDVGGSYFLSRLPHKIGFYLGLTGDRIAYNDCYALGLVDEIIQQDSQNKLIQALVDSALPNKAAVTEVIKQFSVPTSESMLLNHKNETEYYFSKNSVEEIINALSTSNIEWCNKIANTLKEKSPMSLKVTLQELIRGQQIDFDACMDMEYIIMLQFLKSPDFFEGVRAALVDKDRMPRWRPAKLEDISAEDVVKYFSSEKEKFI